MKSHFTIAPQGNYAEVTERMIARAQQDPRIVIYRDAAGGQWLVFCETAELAAYLVGQLKAGAGVNPSFGLVELAADAGTIRVSQECGDEARAQMAEFIVWVLETCRPLRVFDEDSDEELTAMAMQRPRALFE